MATITKHLDTEALAIRIVTGKVDGKDKLSQINFPVVPTITNEKAFEFAAKVSQIIIYPIDGFTVVEKSSLISA